MPLDHYVSQVHLKNFASPALPAGKMYGIRKRDLHVFPCSSRDVCRIPDGSTNTYLQEPRIIEDFLRTIEPRYNAAVDLLRRGEPDTDAVFVVAGFVAYVASCSPTAMRLHAEPLRATVDATARMLEARGDLTPLPPELGVGSLAEALDSGIIRIDIDPRYPQAIGISTILGRTSTFGNSAWEILRNGEADSPFFTSDFPAALEATPDPRVMARVVPLAPDLAVRIYPDLERAREPVNLDFPHFRFRHRDATRAEIRAVNTAVVRAAEELVFFRDDLSWIRNFVGRHQRSWLTSRTDRLPTPEGHMLISGFRVGERPAVG